MRRLTTSQIFHFRYSKCIAMLIGLQYHAKTPLNN